MNEGERTHGILVACSDLMFSARIREAAASQGVAAQFVDSLEKFEAALEGFRAALFLLDLHHHALGGEKAGELLGKLRRSAAGREVFSVAWGRHTEPELLKSAGRAGFDRSIPRSLFVEELPDLVRRAAARAAPGA